MLGEVCADVASVVSVEVDGEGGFVFIFAGWDCSWCECYPDPCVCSVCVECVLMVVGVEYVYAVEWFEFCSFWFGVCWGGCCVPHGAFAGFWWFLGFYLADGGCFVDGVLEHVVEGVFVYDVDVLSVFFELFGFFPFAAFVASEAGVVFCVAGDEVVGLFGDSCADFSSEVEDGVVCAGAGHFAECSGDDEGEVCEVWVWCGCFVEVDGDHGAVGAVEVERVSASRA